MAKGMWAAWLVAVALCLTGAATVTTAEAAEELFVANSGNNSIAVYRLEAGGIEPPLRTLSGLAVSLAGVAVWYLRRRGYRLA
jgi:hypothetical protein